MRRVSVFHDNIILHSMKELSEAQGFEFESYPEELDRTIEWDKIGCAVSTTDFDAHFELQQCPGCCAVLILSYIKVCPYSKEHFDQVVEIVEEAARLAGFGSVMMTQIVPAYSRILWKDEPWINRLDQGWRSSEAFRNAKSGNLCVYLTKDLKQPGKVKGLEERA